VDLVNVARREKISERIPPDAARDWASAMDAYEQELDRVLADFEVARAELRKQEGGGAMVVIASNDGVEADPRLKVPADFSKKVRDLNERYVAQLGQLLSPQDRERWELAYGQRAFGRVYSSAYAQELIDAARQMDGLDATQAEKITELAARYAERSKALNRQWARAQRDLDDATGGVDFSNMTFTLGGEAKEPEDATGRARKAVKEAAAARRELDRATEKAVREALSKDQQAKLPEKQDRGEWAEGGVILGPTVTVDDAEEE
jgi:hypothetical protein